MAGPNNAPVLISVAALDTKFGGDGRASMPVGDGDDQARGLAIQAGGEYLVAGWSATQSGGSDYAVIRVKSDGTLDTTFSADGRLTTDIGGIDQAQGVALQNDGRIVVVGTTNVGASSDVAVVRYNSDGSLDTGFSGDGKVATSLSAGTDKAAAVAIQSDGKIVVLAASDSLDSAIPRLMLVRYNTDGALDATFGTSGVATANFDYFETATAMALQDDGRIVVAGYVWTGFERDLIAARFSADGSLDTSFSGDGLLQIDLGSTIERAQAVAIQPDGKILLAGTTGNDTNSDALLIRLDAAGALDTTFGGGDGIVTLDRSTTDVFNSIAVQADGRIVAAGSQRTGFGEALLARFNADGTADLTFNGDGAYSLTFATGTSAIYDLGFTPNGQIVAAGDSYTGTRDFGVLRLAGGVVDKTATAGTSFTYEIPASAVYDAEGGPLTYSATQAGGADLPAWLAFDPATRSFSGTPQDGDFGTRQLRLTASDGTASVAADFQIEVTTGFIEAMRYTSHFRWNADFPNGTPGTTLSFSFMETVPSYAAGLEASTFGVMGETQRQAVRDALQMYGDIAALDFVEVTDTNGGGQLQFGNYLETNTSTAAYASDVADDSGSRSAIWVNRLFAGYDAPAQGDGHYETLIHEIGHALGLKHPGNYGAGEPPYLPTAEDTTQYTTMSYVDRANDLFLDVRETAPAEYVFDYYTVSASTAMLYDIAAIQFLYGANAATQADDTIYGFDPATPFFKTLWDGGGIDTISLAGFTAGGVIDLRPGHFSSVPVLPDSLPTGYTGTAASYDGGDNLAIAYGVVIEKAVGGSGGDTLIGNSADNVLTGGAGDDALDGGDGVDDAVFSGSKNAYAVVQAGDGTWHVTGADGADTLSNIERLVFADGMVSLVTTNTTPRDIHLLAYSWKPHTLLGGVSITAGSAAGTQITGADGSTSFSGITDSSLALGVERAIPAGETTLTAQAVNLQDAIAILKMIVGLNVNGAGKALSPYQALAADFDANGQVQLTDAIGVLKHVVGLTAPAPAWHFASEADASIPQIAGLSPGAAPAISVDLTGAASAVHAGLVAYLSGDVDGSYAGVAGSQVLDDSQPTYFAVLTQSHGLDPAQFGVYMS